MEWEVGSKPTWGRSTKEIALDKGHLMPSSGKGEIGAGRHPKIRSAPAFAGAASRRQGMQIAEWQKR